MRLFHTGLLLNVLLGAPTVILFESGMYLYGIAAFFGWVGAYSGIAWWFVRNRPCSSDRITFREAVLSRARLLPTFMVYVGFAGCLGFVVVAVAIVLMGGVDDTKALFTVLATFAFFGGGAVFMGWVITLKQKASVNAEPKA